MTRARGFSLIELMVVVLIMAVLAGLASSGYQKQDRKARRAEAKQVLGDLALRQEKWRSNNVAYFGTDSSAAEITAFGAIPTGDYYTIAVTTVENGSVWTATAVPKGDQTADSCATLSWDYNNGVVAKTSTAGSNCW